MIVNCGIAFFIFGLTSSIIGPTLIDIATSFGTAVAFVGLLRSARQVGQFIGYIYFGKAADKFNLRSFAIWGGLAMAIGLICTPYFNFKIALVSVILWGFGHSIYNFAPNVIIGRHFEIKSSSIMTSLHGIYGLGAVSGPWIVEILRPIGLQSIYTFVSTMTLVAALLYWFGTKNISSNLPPLNLRKDSLAEKVSIRLIIPYILGVILFNGANFTASDWIYYYIQKVVGTDSSLATLVLSAFWIGMTGGRFILGWFTALTSEKIVLRFSVILTILAASMLCFPTLAISVILLGATFLGVGLAPVYPILIASAANRFSANRGTITGILAAAGAFGAILIPLLQGWLSSVKEQGLVVVLISSIGMALVIFKIPLNSK